MTSESKCPKCGGERIEVDIGVGIQLGSCLQCGYGNQRDLDSIFQTAPEPERKKEMNEARYFLTVDWCGKGNRGVFCSENGSSFSKDTPITEDDFWDILDAFQMVLAPQSLLLTEGQLKEYHKWIPLEEFSGKYGIALKVTPGTGIV